METGPRAPRHNNREQTVARSHNLPQPPHRCVRCGSSSRRSRSGPLAQRLHNTRPLLSRRVRGLRALQPVTLSFVATPVGRGTCRRPPVWRAVVRPARSFFPRGRAYRPPSARRRTSGTNVLKSSGFGTCRSNPASIAASMSLLDAYPVTAMANIWRPDCRARSRRTSE